MARKKPHAEHENHERWLVSYADFITLLFAFFVVMFATSQTDKAKAQQVSDSVKEALENGGVKAVVHEILGGTVDDKGKGNAQMRGPGGAQKSTQKVDPNQIAELLPSMQFLTKELEHEIKDGKVQVHLEPRGLVISLREAAFFQSGDDGVTASAYGTLETISGLLGKLPNQVRLEGHTDSIPIHNSRFRSNWELSAARAIAMLDVLTGKYNLARARFAIAGYADTAPADSNDTEEGRAHNRRVDVVILNQQAIVSREPAAAQAKPPAKGESKPGAKGGESSPAKAPAAKPQAAPAPAASAG